MINILHQRGVALLIAMMVLLTGSAFYIANESSRKSSSNEKVLQSLLAAKQALLSYAVNYADNYGHNTRGGTGRLPCPALTRHSKPALSCRPNAIGFLPSIWTRDGRRMEIDYLERFLDQDIWYAVAADHRYNPSYNHLNSNKGEGLLSVDNLQDIVAVLIAPGPAKADQNRGAVAEHGIGSSLSAYLEGENADFDGEFTLSESNDLLVPIRRSELLPLMERRILGFVKQWLIKYKLEYGFYPYAAEVGGNGNCETALLRGVLATQVGSCIEPLLVDQYFDDLPSGRALHQTWFLRSHWPSFIYYIVDESCTPVNGLADCDGVDDPERALQVDGQQAEVILVSVGEPIETDLIGGIQVRVGPDLINYLDSVELVSANTTFIVPQVTDRSNDQIVFIN